MGKILLSTVPSYVDQTLNETYDFFNWTALSYASWCGNTKIIKLLLGKDRTDINYQGPGGWTALHLAVNKLQKEVVEILLKRSDLKINLVNKKDMSALELAIEKKAIDIIQVFLERDDINQKDLKKATEFMTTCRAQKSAQPLVFSTAVGNEKKACHKKIKGTSDSTL